MKILAVANQKGGVGKSTLAVHLAYAACEAGKRVLLLDFDRQGSLSMSFPPKEGATGMQASALFAEALQGEPERISETLSIIRADETLSMLTAAVKGMEKRPARNLRALSAGFDVCIIDTPGSIGFNPPMTLAALVAADAVVCPISIGLYEGKGLADLWAYLKSVRTAAYNPRLRLMGLLPSKVNTRSREEMEALQMLRNQFGSVILPLMLAERASVKQAVMRLKPVWRGTRGAGHLAAAREWKEACDYILADLEKKG